MGSFMAKFGDSSAKSVGSFPAAFYPILNKLLLKLIVEMG